MRFGRNVPREEGLDDLMDVQEADLIRDERRPMSRLLHESIYPAKAIPQTREADR